MQQKYIDWNMCSNFSHDPKYWKTLPPTICNAILFNHDLSHLSNTTLLKKHVVKMSRDILYYCLTRCVWLQSERWACWDTYRFFENVYPFACVIRKILYSYRIFNTGPKRNSRAIMIVIIVKYKREIHFLTYGVLEGVIDSLGLGIERE